MPASVCLSIAQIYTLYLDSAEGAAVASSIVEDVIYRHSPSRRSTHYTCCYGTSHVPTKVVIRSLLL